MLQLSFSFLGLVLEPQGEWLKKNGYPCEDQSPPNFPGVHFPIHSITGPYTVLGAARRGQDLACTSKKHKISCTGGCKIFFSTSTVPPIASCEAVGGPRHAAADCLGEVTVTEVDEGCEGLQTRVCPGSELVASWAGEHGRAAIPARMPK